MSSINSLKKEASTAISLLAKEMDATIPDWYRYIDVDILLMDDPCRCIAGQYRQTVYYDGGSSYIPYLFMLETMTGIDERTLDSPWIDMGISIELTHFFAYHDTTYPFWRGEVLARQETDRMAKIEEKELAYV